MSRHLAPMFILVGMLSGCASHHPYLQSEQVDRIQRDVDYLVKSREQIERQIVVAGTRGALVPIPVAKVEQGVVAFVGDTPTDALVRGEPSTGARLDSESKVCYFVYAASAGMPPERWVCQTVQDQVAARTKLMSQLESFEEANASHRAQFAALGSTLDDAVTEIVAIREREVSRNESLVAVIKLLRRQERYLQQLQDTQATFSTALNTSASLQPTLIKALQESVKAQEAAQKLVSDELRILKEKIEAIK
jgi:hypothetical protein